MVYSVPTPELEPGMTLAEPVTNRWGQILLNKGCTLTRRHISVLETWGISSVTIEEGKEMGSPPPLDLATLERISKKVRDRFLWRPVSPLEKVVFFFGLGTSRSAVSTQPTV